MKWNFTWSNLEYLDPFVQKSGKILHALKEHLKKPSHFLPLLEWQTSDKIPWTDQGWNGKTFRGDPVVLKNKKKLTVLLSFESLLSYKISGKSIEHI